MIHGYPVKNTKNCALMAQFFGIHASTLRIKLAYEA